MEKELKITKEKILDAADKNTCAKNVLKCLFPEVFELKYSDAVKELHENQNHEIESAKELLEKFIISTITKEKMLCLLNGENDSIEGERFNDFYDRFCEFMNKEIDKNKREWIR